MFFYAMYYEKLKWINLSMTQVVWPLPVQHLMF